MNHVISTCHKITIAILLGIIFILPANARAEDRVLESITVAENRDHSIVDIRLNQQLTVISYAPLKGGDLLRLKVRRTGSALQIDELPTNFETLPWKPTPELPLYEVTVDLEGAILLNFKRSVNYEVMPGTNAFHILVKVYHPTRITKLPPKAKKLAIKPDLPTEKKIKEQVVEGSENPELAGLMNEARKAMLSNDYPRAIQLYTKVELEAPKSIYAKEALEYLGLARERNQQFAHAKVVYQKYLQLHPKGEDSDRVNQRLMGILTAQTEPNEKLKEGKSKEKQKIGIQWETFGGFSQFYNRFETKFNDDPSRLNRSSIQNGLNITSRMQMQDYQLTGRFTGNYDINIEDSEDDESRISSLYLDLLHKPLDIQFRAGRQSRSSGGILGRFDGVFLSFPALENVRLNFVAGFPVFSSRDISLETDTHFYGINADIGTFFDAVDFNVFYIEQYDHGLLDRRAIGGEVRYFKENHSFFTFLDYDLYHEELNSFLFTGQWIFPDRTIVNISYDYRTSPYLTTSNATQGQFFRGVETLDQLQRFFSIDEIRELAKDRTATSQTVAISLSRPLSEKFQINGDVRWTTFSDTKTSGGVEGFEGTGNEYSYAIDLTGSGLLTEGDIYVLGVRFNDLQRSNSTSFTFNARYPITHDLRINPRFRFDMRENNNGTNRYAFQSSMRVTYRLLKNLQLEVEAGGEWDNQELEAEDRVLSLPDETDEFDRTKGYFVIIGYRYNF
jgi:hypothetical protein